MDRYYNFPFLLGGIIGDYDQEFVMQKDGDSIKLHVLNSRC